MDFTNQGEPVEARRGGGGLEQRDVGAQAYAQPQGTTQQTSQGDGTIRRTTSMPRSENESAGVNTNDGEDEIEWGPSHPCFPHMNPHVRKSEQSTRIIRIKRDWMQVGDLAPTFHSLYPEILEPYIGEDDFRKIIAHINKEVIRAFNPWDSRNILDTFLAVATFWLWEDFGFTAVKSRLNRVESYIESFNTNHAVDGLQIISLRRTGYMSLDFQIPDPHIGLESAV